MDRGALLGYSSWGHKRVGHYLATKYNTNYTLKTKSSVFNTNNNKNTISLSSSMEKFIWKAFLKDKDVLQGMQITK